MFALPEKIRSYFCIQSFIIGMGGVVSIYLLILVLIIFNGQSTLENLEKNLASYIVIIEKNGRADAVVIKEPSETSHHTASSGEHSASSEHSEQAEPMLPAPEIPDTYENISDILKTGAHKSSISLAPAPMQGLTEDSEYGKLPVIGKTSWLTPFDAYKKQHTINRYLHTLSVVITDFGLSESLSTKILSEMPSSVSVILSPYTQNAEKWQEAARSDGHEVWLNIPIQTADFPLRDPGPKGLMTNVSLAYNQERLEWNLGRTTGYTGIASFTDSVMTKSSPMFKEIVNNLFDRGLGFLELNPQGGDFIKDVAKEKTAPYAKTHAEVKVFSEDEDTLSALEAHIKEAPQTIIIIPPTLKNLQNLSEWLEKLERSGVSLAPVSAIADLATKASTPESTEMPTLEPEAPPVHSRDEPHHE